MNKGYKFILLLSIFMVTVFTSCVTTQPGHSGQPNERPPAGNQSLSTGILVTREAATYMRTPYSSPPNIPNTFDCSGFVSHVYAQFGYNLPKATSAYNNVGTQINWKDAQPGDLLVFARERGSNTIDHVAILWKKSDNGELAGSWIIHAASINTGTSMQRGNPDTKIGVVITQLGLRGDGIVENEYFYQRFMHCCRVLEQ